MAHLFTKKELLELGFEETSVTAEESGDKPFKYYTFPKEKCVLISDAIEKGKAKIYVELWDSDFEGKQLSKEFVLACVKEFGGND